jgi:hypothetical protein
MSGSKSTSSAPAAAWEDRWNARLAIALAIFAIFTVAWAGLEGFQDEVTVPLAGRTFHHVDPPDASCNVAGRTISQYEVVNPGPGSLDVTAFQITLFEATPGGDDPFANGLVYENVRACTSKHYKNGSGTVIEVTPEVAGVRRILEKGDSFAMKLSVLDGAWKPKSATVLLKKGKPIPADGEMPDYPGLASTWESRLALPVALFFSTILCLAVMLLYRGFAKQAADDYIEKTLELSRLVPQDQRVAPTPTSGATPQEFIDVVASTTDASRKS